jgi:hypothetical protein
MQHRQQPASRSKRETVGVMGYDDDGGQGKTSLAASDEQNGSKRTGGQRVGAGGSDRRGRTFPASVRDCARGAHH